MNYTISITASKNNIFLCLLDPSGFIHYKDSGGLNCKKGSERKTPRVAEKIISNLIEKVVSSYPEEEFLIRFRNHRYNDKGKVTSQLRYLLKMWPIEIPIKDILNDNKVNKTIVRYKSRRRV